MGKWVKASSSEVIRFYEQPTSPTSLDGVTLADLWVDTSGTPTLKVCSSISPVTFIGVGGGSGSTAPSDAQYVVLSANGTLTNESVLAVGSSKLTLTGATLDVNTTAVATALSLSGTNTGDQDLSGLLVKSNNLSDLTNSGTARTNLGLGTLATQSGTFSGASSGTNTGDQNVFNTIAVSGQSNVVADSTGDTLTLVAGTNVTITTDAATDTITIAASVSGGSGLTEAQVRARTSMRL